MNLRRRHSIADARKNLAAVIRAVEQGAVVELTRRGEPVAVLLSSHDYEELAQGAGDLWEAIRGFRRTSDLKELGIEEVYRDVRDRSPGRKVAT